MEKCDILYIRQYGNIYLYKILIYLWRNTIFYINENIIMHIYIRTFDLIYGGIR